MTTTFDFGDGSGPVPARRHVNPNGSEGRWVADAATVDPTAYFGPSARVYGEARTGDTAMVFGNVTVCGKAQVCSGVVLDCGRHCSGILDEATGGNGPKCWRPRSLASHPPMMLREQNGGAR